MRYQSLSVPGSGERRSHLNDLGSAMGKLSFLAFITCESINASLLFPVPNPLTMSPSVVRRSMPCPNPLCPCPAYLRINRPRYAYVRSRLDLDSTDICTVPHSESSSCAIGCRVHKLRKLTTCRTTDGSITALRDQVRSTCIFYLELQTLIPCFCRLYL